MIKYIGSKRTLVPLIREVASRLPVSTACDLFAGTTRVGQALRRAGLEVLSNDLATYSRALGHAYLVTGEAERAAARPRLEELASLEGAPGYFTRVFCEDARYFQPHNGARVDAIRAALGSLNAGDAEQGLLLTALMEAADRVDSTTGLQMAYLKSWARRSYADLALRMPDAVEGPTGAVSSRDANELAGSLDVDLTYVDPPYNQHSYFANYHVWETLMRWDEPEPYGVAMKRLDVRTTKSDYNSKRRAAAAFDDLLDRITSPWLIVSFNNEGFHAPEHVAAQLRGLGYVNYVEVDFKRYVGAQIGVHSPAGAKVGTVSHLRNKEVLFVVGPNASLVASVFDDLPEAVRGPRREQPALL